MLQVQFATEKFYERNLTACNLGAKFFYLSQMKQRCIVSIDNREFKLYMAAIETKLKRKSYLKYDD